ncbi:MAG: alpha/beta hydrolase [Alphaproteobacteria bacterium]|nr:alpha/beta hydrolase [Alphaproteobacteria bacterium]
MNAVAIFAAVIAVSYAVLVFGLYVLQRSLMYHPDTARPRPSGDLAHHISIEEIPSHDGLGLFSWWAAPADEEKPVVVYFHGNAGTQSDREERVAAFVGLGWGVLMPGYRYNSGAGGTPSEAALLSDARAVLTWLRQRGVTPERTVLYGESLGTGIATTLAMQPETARCLVLDAPYDSIAAVASRHYWFVPVGALLKDRFSSIDRISEVQVPILIGHGQKDRVIPIAHGRRLYEAANMPKTFALKPLAGHTDLFDFGFFEDVVAFVTDCVE